MVTCDVCGALLTSVRGRVMPVFDFFVADCGDPRCRDVICALARRAFGPPAELSMPPGTRDYGPMPGALPAWNETNG